MKNETPVSTTSLPEIGVLDRLRALAVVPVVRTSEAEHATRAVAWLAEAGVGTVEITLTTPGALDLIARLRAETELLVGAGTLRHAKDVARAREAGAQYLVSPAIVPGLAEAAGDVPLVMGALTPTEVLAAHAAGAAAVKVFPVSACGGPAYLRALKSVFPDILLAPTGGVTPDNTGDYLAAGATFVGIGGNLVEEAALSAGNKTAIQSAARNALAAVTRFHAKGE